MPAIGHAPSTGRERIALGITPWTADDDMAAATKADGLRRVRVARPERPCVVLGRSSEPGRELRIEACAANLVPLHRRRGGGCAVVLDPGNVIVSVTESVPGLGSIHASFERLTSWIVRGLALAGVAGVTVDGVSDLVLDGRKVGGSCIQRSAGLVHFSTTILVTPAVELMTRYLTHPPREPGYRAGRDHASFVGSVRQAAPGMTAAELERRLGAILAP